MLFVRIISLFLIFFFVSSSFGDDYIEDYDYRFPNPVQSVVADLAEDLLRQRQNLSWGVFTPRAIIALSFADSVARLNEQDRTSMKNSLNVKLALDLMKDSKMTLSRLGQYINALFAVCENPRDFHGLDLVDQLRVQTNAAMESRDFNMPYALLTLCIAEESIDSDFKKLVQIYHNAGNRTDVKAISLMGMECMRREKKFKDEYFYAHMGNFAQEFAKEEGKNTDVYTKALILQAKISTGHEVNIKWLLDERNPKGMFRDSLSTYYAIPALLDTSLLAVREKCRTDLYEGILKFPFRVSPDVSEVAYSLWIGNGNSVVRTHSILISFVGNKTFFDIMKMARTKDWNFRFNYDDTDEGKKVYTISNIPDDAELNTYWNLYKAESGRVTVNSKRNLLPIVKGVDKVYVENYYHYIFWYQYCPETRIFNGK